ncbi:MULTISPECIES: sodium:solute symporter [unclassified Leucobacter]|uniref:sodium:solute symporter family protein n=1 Tax=unclassified Leucobacter TaxID=2621730 RepID=UPI000A9385D8|nr:sodium:solute symporter family protein [Leucobacter sp. L43]
MENSVVPLIILGLYMVFVVAVGVYARLKSKRSSAKDYLTGSGDVNVWVNGFAIFAAFATGGTMLGNIGLSYAGGWGYITAYNGGVALGYLITTFFLAKTLRNMSVATVPEFIRKRFHNKLLNFIVPLILIGTLIAYLVAQMKVGGLLGEQLFGFSYGWSVIGVGVVYIFYTFYGGMRAVTLTDFVQGLLMISVVVLCGGFALGSNSGAATLYDLAITLRPQWQGTEAFPLASYIGAFVIWATVNAVLPHTVMRIFAAKNERQGRASLAIGLGLYVLTAVVTTVFIVAAVVVLQGGEDLESPDSTFLIFLAQQTPTWLAGLAFAGIFAAVMSSVSAMLLALGGAFAYDLVAEFRPNMSDKSKRRLTSWSVLGFGVLTLVLSLNPPELLTLLYSAAVGLLASGLFFPTLLGVWWKRMNSIGALSGVLVGAVSYLALLWGTAMPALSQVTVSLPLSLGACIIGSLLTKPPRPEELARITIAHEREYTERDDAAVGAPNQAPVTVEKD